MRVDHAGHGFHVVDERRHERFHAFDGNGVGDGFEHVLRVGDGADQASRTRAHRVGELQFAAGRGPNGVDASAGRALVGGVELPDLVDLVAEELDAHRVRIGRREHVEDAAAHRELAAVHDQFDARVRVAHQSFHGLVERKLLAFGEHERLHFAEPGHHGLDQRAHGHYEDADWAEHGAAGFGVLESAEYGHAVRDGVGAGAETFVRQGLPSFELGDVDGVARVPGA